MTMPVQSDFETVSAILAQHRGPDQAITKDDITQAAGFLLPDGRPDRRRTELIIEVYRGRFPFMVVGSSAGMYVAASADDLTREYQRRRKYIRSIAAGWRDLRRQAVARGWQWRGGRFVDPPRSDFLFDMPPADSSKNCRMNAQSH